MVTFPSWRSRPVISRQHFRPPAQRTLSLTPRSSNLPTRRSLPNLRCIDHSGGREPSEEMARPPRRGWKRGSPTTHTSRIAVRAVEETLDRALAGAFSPAAAFGSEFAFSVEGQSDRPSSQLATRTLEGPGPSDCSPHRSNIREGLGAERPNPRCRSPSHPSRRGILGGFPDPVRAISAGPAPGAPSPGAPSPADPPPERPFPGRRPARSRCRARADSGSTRPPHR